MRDLSRLKTNIKNIAVPAELLGEVMALHALMPIGECDQFDARAILIIEVLNEKDYGGEGGLLAMAITVRLMALDALLDDRPTSGWILHGPARSPLSPRRSVNRADQPIVDDSSGQPMFLPEPFYQRVLEIATVRGRS